MKTARSLLDGFRAGTVSPVEALRECLRVVSERDGELRAFVALDEERALGDARAAEAAWRAGTAGPLCGVPVAVKDLFDTEGLATSFGSPVFEGRVPGSDAEAVRRLREAGAVIVGKTRTHEFAWGITMRNARLGPARNPWDPARTPGGSSGGSAVAVAAEMVPLAVGTDTGGSIRLPAALCGVIGHKPTWGLVPLEGVWPLAPSFDHGGPLARTDEDAALLLDVLRDRPLAPAADGRLRYAFALPMEVDPQVEAVLRAVAAEVGAIEVELPDALGAYAPLFGREAVTTHREAGLWPARSDEYDATVAERMAIAERVTDEQVAAARLERELVDRAMSAVFERADLVLAPVCAWAPPPLLEDPVDFRPAVTPLICLQNLLGLPACAFPAGVDRDGMPIGLQVFAARGRDADVLRAAGEISD